MFHISILLVLLLTNVSQTRAFSMKLKDICKSGTYCHYFMDGVKRTLYGSDTNSNDVDICLKEKIEECSCFEMFLLEKLWIPVWPILDAVDMKRLRYKSAKMYHPDLLQHDYKGDRNAPFIFLQKCSSLFQHPGVRKDYRERLEAPLSALGTDNSMELIARNIINNVNIQFMEKHKNIASNVYGGKARNDVERTIERLYIFLDNTVTMKGDGLQKGKKILQQLEKRIFDTPTNIHLTDRNSRKIVNEELELNSQNIDAYVYNIWDASGSDGGGLFLWEYVWYSMKNKKSTDCEIIILTDGYNTYKTGHSTTSFRGVDGLTKLMNNLKANDDVLCRTFVYCVSKECKDEVGKSYLNLTIASGGFACDDSNFDDCNTILASSHAVRVGFAHDLKSDHAKEVKSGTMDALPWFDYRILKADL